MTVRELMEQLGGFDGDTEVQIDFVEIETVELDPALGTVIIESRGTINPQ